MQSVAKQNSTWAKNELATLEKSLTAEHGLPFVMSSDQTDVPVGIAARWIRIDQPKGGFHIKFRPGTGDFMRVGLIEQQAKSLTEIVEEGA